MFETKLHSFSENDALHKRALWEGWLQWANRFSSLDSDNIERQTFGRKVFKIGAFIDMRDGGATVSEDNGLVSGPHGTMAAASKALISLDNFGQYWVDWSLSLQASTGECRFIGGVPFIGNQFIGAAQDFKAEMGWYQNSSISQSSIRGPGWGTLGDSGDPYEFVEDNWDSYGMQGIERHGAMSQEEKDQVGSQLIGAKQLHFVHLSGSGAAPVGRITGNAGILLFCQPNSTFKIIASTLILRKRKK